MQLFIDQSVRFGIDHHVDDVPNPQLHRAVHEIQLAEKSDRLVEGTHVWRIHLDRMVRLKCTVVVGENVGAQIVKGNAIGIVFLDVESADRCDEQRIGFDECVELNTFLTYCFEALITHVHAA